MGDKKTTIQKKTMIIWLIILYDYIIDLIYEMFDNVQVLLALSTQFASLIKKCI